MRSDVAVITPLYNGAPWIEETLHSVAAQTFPPAEHWIIDDGSTDGSFSLAAAFPHATVLRNPHKGANAARAHALSLTRCRYVAMLDQDDVWHPQHLERLENALATTASAPAAVAGGFRFHTGEPLKYRVEDRSTKPLDVWSFFPLNMIPTPGQVLMRRDSLLAAGGWPVHTVGTADLLTWFRLAAGHPLIESSAVTMGYRQHTSSYSQALRREHGRRYMERFLRATHEALDHLRELAPHDAEKYVSRLQLCEAMTHWLGAIAGPDRPRRRHAARALEAALKAHSQTFVLHLWAQVFYFMDPASVGAPWRRIRRLASLYLRAPLNSPEIRGSLRRIITHKLRTMLRCH